MAGRRRARRRIPCRALELRGVVAFAVAAAIFLVALDLSASPNCSAVGGTTVCNAVVDLRLETPPTYVCLVAERMSPKDESVKLPRQGDLCAPGEDQGDCVAVSRVSTEAGDDSNANESAIRLLPTESERIRFESGCSILNACEPLLVVEKAEQDHRYDCMEIPGAAGAEPKLLFLEIDFQSQGGYSVKNYTSSREQLSFVYAGAGADNVVPRVRVLGGSYKRAKSATSLDFKGYAEIHPSDRCVEREISFPIERDCGAVSATQVLDDARADPFHADLGGSCGSGAEEAKARVNNVQIGTPTTGVKLFNASGSIEVVLEYGKAAATAPAESCEVVKPLDRWRFKAAVNENEAGPLALEDAAFRHRVDLADLCWYPKELGCPALGIAGGQTCESSTSDNVCTYDCSFERPERLELSSHKDVRKGEKLRFEARLSDRSRNRWVYGNPSHVAIRMDGWDTNDSAATGIDIFFRGAEVPMGYWQFEPDAPPAKIDGSEERLLWLDTATLLPKHTQHLARCRAIDYRYRGDVEFPSVETTFREVKATSVGQDLKSYDNRPSSHARIARLTTTLGGGPVLRQGHEGQGFPGEWTHVSAGFGFEIRPVNTQWFVGARVFTSLLEQPYVGTGAPISDTSLVSGADVEDIAYAWVGGEHYFRYQGLGPFGIGLGGGYALGAPIDLADFDRVGGDVQVRPFCMGTAGIYEDFLGLELASHFYPSIDITSFETDLDKGGSAVELTAVQVVFVARVIFRMWPPL